MDRVSLKLAALSAAPAFLRRHVMERRFRHEVEQTGEAELALLANFVSKADLAIDVGANLGSYTYELARLCGNVVAFEPNPAMSQALRSLNLRGVEVRDEALCDQDGEAILYLPFGQRHVLASIVGRVADTTSCRHVPVQTAALDSFGYRDVRFVKIDVEGAEERVIEGAWATISRDRPVLLIEIEERHNPGGLHRICDRLSDLGYSGSFYRRGWQPIQKYQADMQDVAALTGSYTSRRQIPYINNFLFKSA